MTATATQERPSPPLLPRCESCERHGATVTIRFADDAFQVCTGCVEQDLLELAEPLLSTPAENHYPKETVHGLARA